MMETESEKYFNTLIDFLSEPEAVERFLKACIAAYALVPDQLQSLVGCAEEVYEYLNGIDTAEPLTGLEGYWERRAYIDYEEFEFAKEQVWKSKVLLQEYIDLWEMTRSNLINRK
jgi:hypothetical protein